MSGSDLILIIGFIICILGGIGIYVSASYGLHLLVKKYEPEIDPLCAWLPILNLYVIIKLSQRSPLWVLGIFIPILNIYTMCHIYYGISSRTGRGIGTMLLLIFFMPITLLWLGFKVNELNTKKALIGSICSILCVMIGLPLIFGGIMSMTTSVIEAPILD